MLKKSLIVCSLVLSLPIATAYAQVADPLVKKTVRQVLNVYKKNGMSGLQVETGKCYKEQKLKMNCIYFDYSSRILDSRMIEAMGWSEKAGSAYFSDESFLKRIGPVYAKSSMDMDAANAHLTYLAQQINVELTKQFNSIK